MSTYRRIDAVIYRAERTRNSASGNPGYRFHTSAGVYTMVTDASLGYAVDNFIWSDWLAARGRDNLVIGNPAEPTVTLLLDGTRVAYIEHNGVVLT